MKTCRDCGEYYPFASFAQNYTNMRSGKEYRQNICRACTQKQDHARRTLGKIHARPEIGAPCECCGRISKLFLDHCHVSKAFRGFICRECNCGLGYLGDCARGVEQALVYLARSTDQANITP